MVSLPSDLFCCQLTAFDIGGLCTRLLASDFVVFYLNLQTLLS
jgi:hypothetical protein